MPDVTAGPWPPAQLAEFLTQALLSSAEQTGGRLGGRPPDAGSTQPRRPSSYSPCPKQGPQDILLLTTYDQVARAPGAADRRAIWAVPTPLGPRRTVPDPGLELTELPGPLALLPHHLLSPPGLALSRGHGAHRADTATAARTQARR